VTFEQRFAVTISLVVLASVAGYVARRAKLVPERLAQTIMTWVVVFGYSSVGLLGVWGLKLRAEHAWLPVLGFLKAPIMAGIGALVARAVFRRDSREQGLMTIAPAIGNTSFTMGGFVAYILFAELGVELVSVYGVMWHPMIVTIIYPIARHFGEHAPGRSLARLMLRSIFDWRSLGMFLSLTGLTLSLAGVPRPAAVSRYFLIDGLMLLVIALAYFSIGLRLHVSGLKAIRQNIWVLALLRFVVAAGVGLGLVTATRLTPWPLGGEVRSVALIEAFVPMAVTVVAVSNMFNLRPRDASLLFIVNTVMYLVLVLPIVLWVFG